MAVIYKYLLVFEVRDGVNKIDMDVDNTYGMDISFGNLENKIWGCSWK